MSAEGAQKWLIVDLRDQTQFSCCVYSLVLFHLVCQGEMALGLGEGKGNEILELCLVP